MEGGQPRINLNHLKPAANTRSEREEPKVRPKKRAGAWTIQRPESPSENPGQGKVSTPKRREELRHGRGLLTQVRANVQGRDPWRQKERVRPKAKVSGRRNRASEESKTQESQEGPQTCDQSTPTPEKVKDQQTQEKDDEPQRAAETAFAAHKHWRHRRPEAHPLYSKERVAG